MLNLTMSKFSSMIDRSAVQCLLDMLVSDCTLLDTRLGCFQAARQHHISLLQEPLYADEYMYYSACVFFLRLCSGVKLMRDQRRSKLVTHAVPHLHQRMLFVVALSQRKFLSKLQSFNISNFRI